MSWEKENENLRLKLEKITKSKKPIPLQIREIKNLGIPSIAEPSSWASKKHSTLNINCFGFALGLAESNKYRDCAYEDAKKKTHLFFAGLGFMKFLLADKKNRPISRPSAGALVLYFNTEGKPTHAGLLLDFQGKVRSKWGTLAIFEHDLFEVPKQYGTTVKYYGQNIIKDSEDYFFDYVKSLK